MRRAVLSMALGAVISLAVGVAPSGAKPDEVVTVVEPNLTEWGESIRGVRVSGYLTGNWRDVAGRPRRLPSPPLPRDCRVRKMTLTLDEKTIVARASTNAEAEFTLHWAVGYVQPGHYVVRALPKRDRRGNQHLCKGNSREFWIFGSEGP